MLICNLLVFYFNDWYMLSWWKRHDGSASQSIDYLGNVKGLVCYISINVSVFFFSQSMSPDFQHYSFRMPNIGFQNLPLNIYIVVFGTAIFVFILSLLFCCYLIRYVSDKACLSLGDH